MVKIYDWIMKLASRILAAICTGMLIIALGVKAVYCYDDSPAFVQNGVWDAITLSVIIVLLLLGIHWRDILNRHISAKCSIAIYCVIAVLFILLVPLKPFSDMQQIYDGAIEIAKGNLEYFHQNAYFMQYPNNMLITLIYGGILFFFPKNAIVLKLLNILMVVGTVIISEKILQIYWKNSYRNLFYVYGLSLVSVLLYVNHVYTDLIFVFFSLLGIYLYLKKPERIWYVIVIFGALYFIRPQAVFYVIAIVIHYLIKYKAGYARKIMHVLCGVVLFFGCRYVVTYGIETPIIGDIDHSMPAASYVYMAFNEEEFGFQDGSHDLNRKFSDVVDRLQGYDKETLLKIIGKKLEWTWTEGTYQAQRYAFGENSDTQDKFEYATPVTGHCLDSGQRWRNILDSFMRNQYLILFALTIPMFWKKNRGKYDIFVMLFAANMVFYVFWEIKSRYLLPLYPLMFIASFITMDNMAQQWKNKGLKGRKND